MGNRSAAVDQFMDELDHPRRAEIDRLRLALLAAHPELTEHIKWNAPSFVAGGVDRVTFRLQPRTKLQLILHRGPKVRADAEFFAFRDDTDLIRWAAPDRGVVTIDDDPRRADEAIVALVGRWIAVD